MHQGMRSRGHVLQTFKDDNETDDKIPCPFSMTFQRYRIPLTRGKDTPAGSVAANKKLGFLSDIKTSLDRKTLERKYPSAMREGSFLWFDAISNLSLPEKGNEKERQVFKGRVGVRVSAIYWRALADLTDTVGDEDNATRTVVLGLPNSSSTGLKQLVDISNWLEELSLENVFSLVPKATVHAEVDADAPVPTVLLRATAKNHGEGEGVSITQQSALTLDIVEKRMKSWVNRILVRMEICPFTKSNSKSGQGLDDVGVPVAKIAYHYSSASTNQIYNLLADTWEAISQMIIAGPSGKNGISSILLSAPEFDRYFKLWAGPIFAILEANVSAASAEPIVGVVCFHPNYVTPDGNTWPGFGHMHSLPRLRKWLTEQDEALSIELSDTEIAAGGAWQRRTPHSTINVLRADQLEVAEGRRVSGSLYSDNIRKLYETGFAKLDTDLKKEIVVR